MRPSVFAALGTGRPNHLAEELKRRVHHARTAVGRAVQRLAGRPGLDVIESPAALLVELDLPGIDPERCIVHVSGGWLYVSGERDLPEAAEGERFIHRERRGGHFTRELRVGSVDPVRVTARYRAGVLRISLPKRPDAEPYKIAIEPD